MTGNRKRTITCHVARVPRCQTLELLGCVFDEHLEILADVIHGAVQTLHLPVPPARPFQGHSHLLCRDAVEGPELDLEVIQMFFEILQILHDISPFFWCSLIYILTLQDCSVNVLFFSTR